MKDVALILGTRPVTWGEVALAMGAAALLLLLFVTVLILRSRRDRAFEEEAAAERAREMDDKVAELTRIQAEMTGRMQTIAEVFGSRQSDFVRVISERIDGLQHRLGQGLEATSRHQSENLSKLNERLAVIDAAQRNLKDLTGEIVGLRDILSNKQTRGAYGQGRMEAIIRDGLPSHAFEFQPTLSNRTRPDCVVRLPGDARGLVIDAKFPLEGFTLFRDARGDEARARAMTRVRSDILVHVRDIAEKYLIAGETQDIAMMFVPAESVYADLAEHFDDVVQKAHRARVVQVEVQKLLEDVTRLDERVAKLDGHFRQAQDDVAQIRTSADKIVKRGQKIEALEFEEGEAGARAELLRLQGRSLRAVE